MLILHENAIQEETKNNIFFRNLFILGPTKNFNFQGEFLKENLKNTFVLFEESYYL